MQPSHEKQPQATMTNANRRTLLCAQHDQLRRTIQSTQVAARDVLASHGLAGVLQAAVTALHHQLLIHLADEERLLEPVLSTLDAWGPVRASLLRAEHAHQRAVLAILVGHTAWPAGPIVARRALALCDDLLTDMDFEERELLNDKVLRDDFILIDASDA